MRWRDLRIPTLPSAGSLRQWLRNQRSRRCPALGPCATSQLHLETLEAKTLLAGDSLVISEIMASNSNTLADGSVPVRYPDWIEIHNPLADEANLSGWHLTDNRNRLEKWTFPDGVTLGAGQYLVVFASGDGVPDLAGNIHTNFRLAGSGEYLALVEPDGETVAFEIAPEFPPQFDDVSYGLAASSTTSPLLSAGAAARALVPSNDSLAQTWTEVQFDDAAWKVGTTGIGFETQTGYENQIGLDLRQEMHTVNPSAYARIPFNVDNPDEIDRLILDVQYDDGFVAYLNGDEVASRNARSTADSPSNGLISYWDFDQNLSDQANRFENNSGVANDNFTVRSGGAARFVPGISGRAVALDAVASDARSLRASDSLDSRLGPVYTIETWIYPTALNAWGRLVLNWDAGQSYHFALRDGSRVSLFHNEAGGPNKNIDSVQNTVKLGAVAGWQQIVGVADGSRLRVYYNGEEVGSTPYDGSINTVTTGLGLGDIASGGAGANLRYQGYVDDLAIWNVALTPEQIRSHYEAGGDGYGLTEIGASTELSYNSAASRERADAEALVPERIDISSHLDLIQTGENVLAIQGLNRSADDADFLVVPQLQAAQVSLDPQVRRYFSVPTPAAANGLGVADLGPVIRNPAHTPSLPADNQPIAVTAQVTETNEPIGEVRLHYRAMYSAETSIAMFDDGAHGDGGAGDGVYGATIPASASRPGEMVRWYVTANDTNDNSSRWPLFEDPNGSAEYLGTVIDDPASASDLPQLQWFVQNRSAAETGSGTRASVFYLDQFYDNVFVRIRGQTSRNWPKKSYKFDFNRGDHFRFAEGQPRVEEINLNTTYTDKSYVRTILAYESFRDAGVAYSETFPLRIEQNGNFFSVALFVEQVDADFLDRNNVDPEGALYKGLANGLVGSTNGLAKKTRRDEDASDMQAFISGLALSGDAKRQFLFDNADLAAQVNYMATNIIIQDIDRTVKNYYIYRDTNGTGEWFMVPWDEDLTFGPDALNTNVIDATDDFAPDHSSHPFMGGSQFPFRNLQNRFLDAIYRDEITREMFLRRLRTLMDQMLQSPDTPAGELQFENRLDALFEQMEPDVIRDRARWGGSAHFGGATLSFQGEINRLKNEYFARRRPHLFVSHNIENPNNYARNVGIPNQQLDYAALPAAQRGISFGVVEFAPASGNQDEEYIEIINENDVAIDVSGWKLAGGVEHTFRAGRVIPAGMTLYVSPDPSTFRARSSGPSGGQSLLVEGGYRGHLSSLGETIQLLDDTDREITSVTYQGLPSPVQQYLRVSEIMYHPPNDGAGEFLPDDFEFVELVNTGSESLDLAGVHFSQGIEYVFDNTTFPAGARILIVKNADAFAQRYPTNGLNVAGTFAAGTLDNGGESLKLEDADNGTVVDFRYDDDWFPVTDGEGFSLTARDASAGSSALSQVDAWRPSSEYLGSPGAADGSTVPAPGTIVINEALTHTNFDGPGQPGDRIEILNTADTPIDIGGWYLSDTADDRRKFEIPESTIIAPGGLAVFDQLGAGGFGEDPAGHPGAFGLSELGDAIYVSSVDADRIAENVDAIHVRANGRIVLSTAASAVLGAAAFSFGNGDLVEYDPVTGAVSLVHSEDRFGAGNENIDAVYLRDSGRIALSTAGDAQLGGLSFRDGDLIEYDAISDTAQVLISEDIFDGDADIDAAHIIEDGAGEIVRYIISTSNDESLLSQLYDDGDLISITPGAGTNLAAGDLTGATVTRFLSESIFATEPGNVEPTENVDATHVAFAPGGDVQSIFLSTSSRATFNGLGTLVENGDVVRIDIGTDPDLARGDLGDGAAASLTFEEDPVGARTFHGALGSYREEVRFGAAQREMTFGRHVNSDGSIDFVAQSTATIGSVNAGPAVGPIVFNEIMYNPPASQSEYLELHNITGGDIVLADPSHPQNTWRLTDGVVFPFPEGTTIPAGGYLVVLPETPPEFADFGDFSQAFRADRGVAAAVDVMGPYQGSLANGGEAVALSMPGDPEPGGADIMFSDSFDRADSTSLGLTDGGEQARAWTERIGDFAISNNRLTSVGSSTAAPHWLATIDSGQADVVVQTKMRFATNSNSSGIVGRYVDNNQFWMVSLLASTNRIEIWERHPRFAGGWFLHTSRSVSIDLNTDYQLEAQFNGQTIVGTVDGGSPVTHTAAATGFSETLFGVRAQSAAISFDDLVVRNHAIVPHIVVDRVRYDDSLPWPQLADGLGSSLSRVVAGEYGNDPANWAPSVIAGTPGQPNVSFDNSPPTVPQNLQSTVVARDQIDLAWTAATDPQSGVEFYNVYRNSTLFDTTVDPSYSDTSVETDIAYRYEVTAVNRDGFESDRSLHSAATILTLVAADPISVTQIEVTYSAAVDSLSSEDTANYVLTGNGLPAVAVLQAALGQDGLTLTLTTSPLEESADYVLAVHGITGDQGVQLPPSGDDITVSVPDLTLPTVQRLLLRGSAWTATYLDYLASNQLGDGGLAVATGPGQLSTVASAGIDQLLIQFSEDVLVRKEDLTLRGSNQGDYPLSSFHYDEQTFTGTWTLPTPMLADKLLIRLADDVQDPGGNPIDGNWQDAVSTFPSGNGVTDADDDFDIRVNVLPADANHDARVDRMDLFSVLAAMGSSQSSPFYDIRQDVNSDGRITFADVRNVVGRLATSLPVAEPDPNSGGSAGLIPTDAVFERTGEAGSPVESRRSATQRSGLSPHVVDQVATASAESFTRRPARVAGRRMRVLPD